MKTCEPAPRVKNFLLGKRREDLTTGKRGAAETPKGENFVNWQIARRIFSMRAPAHERCVTYELPLCATAEGQLKADLVVFNASGLVEIVELKRSAEDGTRDNPLMALVEGICYTLQMLRCWRDLAAELTECIKVARPPHTINIVLAAPDYWDHCHGIGKPIADDETSALHTIVDCVSHVLQNQHDVPSPSIVLTLANVIDDRLFRCQTVPAEPPLLDSIVET
jgi:hypothetical protein